MQYLSTQNAKTVKGEALGFRTFILYLTPASLSGVINLCPFSSEGCRLACLYSSGRGAFQNVQDARLGKTLMFAADPRAFVETLAEEISDAIASAQRAGLQAVFRLNGTSDIAWEKLGGTKGKNLFDRFPDAQFYDYTKSAARALASGRGEMPRNYSLTFSRSECNEADALRVLRAGGNVAAVFAGKLPAKWRGFRVVVGDESDLRFADPTPCVVGLTAKGAAKRDDSGFVIA